MSFLKSLFGGGNGGDAGGEGAVLAEESYKGYTIKATEMRAGSEYQLSGVIEKGEGDAMRSHRFIRADRLSSKDQAGEMALVKARQIIDEQGDRIFD